MKTRITIKHETGQPVIIKSDYLSDEESVIDIGAMLYLDKTHIGIKSFLDHSIKHYDYDQTTAEFLQGRQLIRELNIFHGLEVG
jgi:hypothetical protein